MARMIPDSGPNLFTGSPSAEYTIYKLLKDQLPDEFTVIHSLSWLCEKAKEFDDRPVFIGEIDFLILHPDLGILALEVKGGKPSYDGSSFLYPHNNQKIDPVRQVNRGRFALAAWLKDKGVRNIIIDFAVAFPEGDVRNKPLPPSLNHIITLDKTDIFSMGERIENIMNYWQEESEKHPLGVEKKAKIIDLICPQADYTPGWKARITYDTQHLLKLDEAQVKYLKGLMENQRGIVTGWPGTGKTLIAMSLARQLAESDNKVLFLVYNKPLSEYLKNEFSDVDNCRVSTFHQLCSIASARTGNTDSNNEPGNRSRNWFEQDAAQNLRIAVEADKMTHYDALIIDEAQVFDKEWLNILKNWFENKKIVVFCDETQVFEFEKSTSLDEITNIIEAPPPYVLTYNYRSPKIISEVLQEVKQSYYQLINNRDDEPDTLAELSVANPETALREILNQLRDECVSNSDITVLFHKKNPPEFAELKDYPYRTESIARFRGLESSVTIIYVPGECDENLLFSAYSRATTRCIVIYDAYETINHSYGFFSKRLLESEKNSEIEQEAGSGYIVNILKRLNITRQSVVSHIVKIYWCFEWGCWLIIEDETAKVVAKLWLDYLQDIAIDPILYIESKAREDFLFYDSILRNIGDLNLYPTVELRVCSNCNNTTPHRREARGVRNCVLCIYSLPRFNNYSPIEVIKNLKRYEEILLTPKGEKREEKYRLPPSLLAVGFWNAINKGEDEMLSKTVTRTGGSLYYRAAVVLTLVDILKTPKNDSIELNELSKKYHDLYESIGKLTFNEWKKNVSLALELWVKRDLINKPKKGLFIRN